MHLGQPAEAEADAAAASAALPSWATPRVLMAQALVQLGRPQQALAEAELACRLEPGEPIARALRFRLRQTAGSGGGGGAAAAGAAAALAGRPAVEWICQFASLSCKAKLAELQAGGRLRCPPTAVLRSGADVDGWLVAEAGGQAAAAGCTAAGCGREAEDWAEQEHGGWYVKHPRKGGGDGCSFCMTAAEAAAASRVVLADTQHPTATCVVQRAVPLGMQALLPRGPSRIELRLLVPPATWTVLQHDGPNHHGF